MSEKSRDNGRNAAYQKKYDITLNQYDAMFDEQNGVCAICGKPETKKYHGVLSRLSVDHNHDNKVVRGLLCQKCNAVLGFVNEDITILLEMIKYINKKG